MRSAALLLAYSAFSRTFSRLRSWSYLARWELFFSFLYFLGFRRNFSGMGFRLVATLVAGCGSGFEAVQSRQWRTRGASLRFA